MKERQAHRKVVFISGPGHSGSTLLGLILGSHSQAAGLGEIVSIPKFLKENYQFPRLCRICLESCPFWNEPEHERIVKQHFAINRIQRLYRQVFQRPSTTIYHHIFEWTGARVLIDFSKPQWWIKQQLATSSQWQNIEPVLLFNMRDGRATVSSQLRKHPERNMKEQAGFWKKNVLNNTDFFNKHNGLKKLVRYEEVVTQPAQTFLELCTLLDLSYESTMLPYWKHDHHIVSGNGGTRSLILKYKEQEGEIDNPGFPQHRTGEEYYKEMGLALKVDMRWKAELSTEQQTEFQSIAGEVNQLYAFED